MERSIPSRERAPAKLRILRKHGISTQWQKFSILEIKVLIEGKEQVRMLVREEGTNL